MNGPFEDLIRRLDALDAPAVPIRQAVDLSIKRQRSILDRLPDRLIDPDCSLVVFGSTARGAATTGSDVDWTLMVFSRRIHTSKCSVPPVAGPDRQPEPGRGHHRNVERAEHRHQIIDRSGRMAGSEDARVSPAPCATHLTRQPPASQATGYPRQPSVNRNALSATASTSCFSLARSRAADQRPNRRPCEEGTAARVR